MIRLQADLIYICAKMWGSNNDSGKPPLRKLAVILENRKHRYVFFNFLITPNVGSLLEKWFKKTV